MKATISLKNLVLGAVLGAAIMFAVGAATSNSNRTAWEFKVVNGKVFQHEFEKALNAAAEEGWEFVSASPYVDQFAWAVMKREKK